MGARYKLYIDSEGITRGYYVYLHKVRGTDEVFYVGKGNGQRAWDAEGRHALWKEKVASLADGWDAEIVKQDLSEIEAFEFEAGLVEQYGGCAANGGSLTNWIPGGEDPASIKVGIKLDDRGWFAAYRAARTFNEYPRGEEEAIVRILNKEIGAVIGKLMGLEQEAEDRNDEKLSDSVMDVDGVIRNLSDIMSDFLVRRVSWKDFAITLEEACEDLKSELEEIGNYHKKVKALLKQAYRVASKVLLGIDSGNMKEAEETATRMTSKG